jgi:hypothetical protein
MNKYTRFETCPTHHPAYDLPYSSAFSLEPGISSNRRLNKSVTFSRKMVLLVLIILESFFIIAKRFSVMLFHKKSRLPLEGSGINFIFCLMVFFLF